MVKAKKHLGQHFLRSNERAIQLAENLSFSKHVLEVGPGTGILTKELLKLEGDLKAAEVDDESIDFLLGNRILDTSQIIRENFLKLNLAELNSKDLCIAGNFPYYISSQIVIKVIENYPYVIEMIGMFQKEVAQRIVASPGSKTYGGISVLVASRYDTKYLFELSEDEFSPPPKVKSAVISMIRKESPLSESSYAALSRVVKLAFNQRRKTLRNSLKSISNEIEIPSEMLQQRPEQLSLKDFLVLSEQLLH